MGASTKVAAALKRYGRAMKLRRRIGTTSSYVDVDVKGVASGFKPDELVGLVQQGDRSVIISNAEIAATGWPGPPRKGDFVVIDGVTAAVQGAEAKYLGSEVLAHVVWVRG